MSLPPETQESMPLSGFPGSAPTFVKAECILAESSKLGATAGRALTDYSSERFVRNKEFGSRKPCP
jgi:hypothetical protein